MTVASTADSTTPPDATPVYGTPPADGAALAGRVVDHQGEGPVDAETAGTTSRARRWVARVARVGKGLSEAPGALRDWKLATEYDFAIQLAEAQENVQLIGAARKEQERIAGERRERAQKFHEKFWPIAVPATWGGWFWFTFGSTLLLLGSLVLLQRKAMSGRAVMRIAEATVISLGLEVFLGAALGVHPAPLVMAPIFWPVALLLPVAGGVVFLVFGVLDGHLKPAEVALIFRIGIPIGVVADIVYLGSRVQGLAWAWSPWYLLPLALFWLPVLVYAVVWAWKATADDGSIADDLRAGEAPMVPAEPDTEDARDGSVVAAVAASDARLPKDASLSVVAPGVMPLAGGKMWTVTLDTGGPDAGPIVAARKDVASRLGLSGQRLLVEQSKDLGRRVKLTGIVQSPWGDPIPSPLIDAERFRFGDPIPYGPELVSQQRWDLPMYEMHYLVGGAMRRGKSTSCYPIYAAAALDRRAPIWIADGGDVDTRPWHDAGVTRAWVTDAEEVPDMLDLVLAEIDMRQDLLGQAHKVRPDDEFYAEHDMSDGLLGMDEFAGYTNHPDRKLAGKITRKLVSVIQKSPKTNIHVVLSAQSPSAKAFDTDGRGVITGRAALLCDSPEMSDKILGSGSAARGLDASVLDDTIKGLQVMSVPGFTGIVRPYLITPEQVQRIAHRAAVLRGVAPATEPSPPEIPRVLVELRRLLAEPSRRQRMLTAEAAAAMRACGIVEVTDADRVGAKTDEQIGQEKLAALVSPFGVRARPDRDAGNRAAYWLTKEHREHGDVGVQAAIDRLTSGKPTGLRGGFPGASAGSPEGVPGRPQLHVV